MADTTDGSDGGGFLVTTRGGLTPTELDTVAQMIEQISGVADVRRYVDDSANADVALNDARWRESIIHLLDDEGV